MTNSAYTRRGTSRDIRRGVTMRRAVIDWLRSGNSLWRLVLLLAVVAVLLAVAVRLLLLYAALKLLMWGARKLFVRGEGRDIRADAEPYVRKRSLRRAGGRAVDFGLVFAVASAVGAVSTAPTLPVFLVLSVAYFTGGTYLDGSTVGKSLLGLEVVPTSKSRLTPVQCVVRETIATLSLFVFPIAAYVVMKNENGEQMGDIVADTAVMEGRPTGMTGLRAHVAGLRAAVEGEATNRPSSASRTGGAGTKMQSAPNGGPATKMQQSSTPSGGQSPTASTNTTTKTQSSANGATKTQSSNAPNRSPSTAGKSPNAGPSPNPGQSPNAGNDDTDVFDSSGAGGTGTDTEEDTAVFDRTDEDAGSNVRFCPDCGESLPDASSFCPECGTRV